MTAVPVIGRQVERDAIDAWLRAARPGTLLIDGVAGIGKSTLWSYAVERAGARGDQVLAWRASEAERDIAFATLTALLDTPAAVARLAAVPDPRRTALAVALGRADPTLRPPAPSLVGLAVVDLLRLSAAVGPVLVGVDDLQWADRASADALAYAARRLTAEPVAFALSRRTGEPLAFAPARAGPAAGPDLGAAAMRVEVGPMDIATLGRLVRDRLGVALPRPLLLRVHAESTGNAFLALEMSRWLMARGDGPDAGEPFPVLSDAGLLVRDHLATLSRAGRRGVALVAMSPDPRWGRIEAAVGPRGGRALDEACRKGILVAYGDRLRPAHPLFTSTAYADTPPGERRALRRRLAELADDPVERAVHLAATVTGRDAAAAAALATAADLALARGAPAVAAELWERASGVAAGAGPQAAHLVSAAGAASAAGDPATAVGDLRAALDLVATGPTRVAALLAWGEIRYVERPADAMPLLVEALDHTGGDPVAEALVLSHIAAMGDGDPDRASGAADRAAALLDRPGVRVDPDHLACALLDRAFHCLLRGEAAVPGDIDRGLALRTPSGRSFVARRAQEVAERCLFHFGRIDEARALDEAEYRRLAAHGEFGLLPPMAQTLSVLALLSGDWPAARRYAAECADYVAQGAEVWRERSALAVARIHAADGDLDAARAIAGPALDAQEAAGDRWEAAIFAALLGFVELSAGEAPAALRHLTRACDHADAIGVRLPTQFRFLGDLTEAAVLAGHLDLAESVLVDRLEPAAARQGLPWTRAMSYRGRALLATARGDLDPAIAWGGRALAVFDAELPMPFERARTLYARSQAYRRAGRRRAARADLTAAVAAFAELGARAWHDLARAEMGRIGGRAPAGADLTAAEREVALRAATGRSNKEIATELMVSARTVESQLAAVYRKLDVHTRGQLAGRLRVNPGP